MTGEVKLLPCAFCGDKNTTSMFDTFKARYLIRCCTCGACGSHAESHEEAIAAWNTRTKTKTPTPGLTDDVVKELVEALRLDAREQEMLLGIYRGRISSIHCDSLGDKAAYDRTTGTWKNVGTVSPDGAAWLRLKRDGLLNDYDSFGGFHYCKITKAGKREAERIIAAKLVKHSSEKVQQVSAAPSISKVRKLAQAIHKAECLSVPDWNNLPVLSRERYLRLARAAFAHLARTGVTLNG